MWIAPPSSEPLFVLAELVSALRAVFSVSVGVRVCVGREGCPACHPRPAAPRARPHRAHGTALTCGAGVEDEAHLLPLKS